MKISTLKPAFKDHRGTITDVIDGLRVNAISRVTQKKGTVRGNHLHKRTVQWLYLVRGRLKYVAKKGEGKPQAKVMKPGDLALSPPGEAHATLALTDCEFIAMSWGPRHGRSYESDTFRVEPLA